MQQIKDFISKNRFPLTDEKETQAKMEKALTAAGFEFEREVRLSEEDTVDFMIGGVVVEVKLKGSPTAIYRQLERYAKHERVTAVLLVTARSMTLPAQILGKPASVSSLSRAWL